MRIRVARWLLAASCLVAADGILPETVRAETRTAAALTPEAVWAAIDAAKDGDTVQLPEGTADWSTGWNASHGAKMKAITIQGAGMDKTVICDRRSRDYFVPFQLQGVEGKPFRVTGITFTGPDLTRPGPSNGFVWIGGTCKNFRIDHCKFKNAQTMMFIVGDTYGLIDHCSFDDKDYERSPAQPIWCSGPGAQNCRKPLSLGTAAALYLEDNEVYLGPGASKGGDVPWIAPNNGARVVIRHNNIVNAQIEVYGVGVQKGFYGCQQAEIYDNTFSAIGMKQGSPQVPVCGVNAGVAIVFNNTVTGTTYNCKVIQLCHERSFQDRGGFGMCDGKNPIDGNAIPADQPGAGYPAMNQPGRGTDADGDGVFEPSPCYAWNNTINGAKLNMALRRWGPKETELQAEHVKEGRDFFNEKPPERYYKPYVYPHPLQEGWEALLKSAAGVASADSGRFAGRGSLPESYERDEYHITGTGPGFVTPSGM